MTWVTLKGGARGSYFSGGLLNNARTVWSRTTKFGSITHLAQRSIYRRSATPLKQEGGAQTLPNFVGLCTHPVTQNYQIWRQKFTAHVGRRLVFRGQPRPHPNGSGSQRSPILGIPSIYAYTLCRSTIKFDVVTQVGRGVYLGSATLPIPRVRSSRADHLWEFSCIYAYTI